MKKYKNKIILAIVIVFLLLFSFWWGGNSPSLRGTDLKEVSKPVQTVQPSLTEESEKTIQPTEIIENKADEKLKASQTQPDEIKKQQHLPEQIKPEKKELSCTISISCDTIRNNMDWLTPEKKEMVPDNGVILSQKTVTFNEGETVFDVLLKAANENGIHMEFVNTPMYKSSYIEGIANIYEFDCGELSGWMYRVNGEFPNFGCSLYKLKDGDKIEWIYSCDLGADVGAKNVTQR